MKNYWLVLIVGLGLLLRLIGIGFLPVGFTPDEASFGYDAYSLLKTGRDQWGKSLPLVLESFGDFKAPLFAYLAIPSIAVFGLNPFGIRFPNALLGTGAILVVYLLVKKMFQNKNLALISAFVLSVSSWHISLSRGGFEANLVSFFIPLGIFLYFARKYFWSALIFGVSLFSYHSAKLVVPLTVVLLLVIFRKLNWKFLLIFGVFAALMVYTFWLGAGRRATDVSILNGSLLEAAERRINWINNGANPVFAHFVYNKYTVSGSRFIKNYLSYFSTRFLLAKGAGESTYGMVKGFGVLSLVEWLSLIFFAFSFIKKRDLYSLFILFWIFIAPLPAALSQGVGYAANRAATMLPALQIASSLGLFYLIKRFSENRKLIGMVFILGLFVNLFIFGNRYLQANQSNIAQSMLYGNLAAMTYVRDNFSDKAILISTSLSEPHIYWAFVNKIDPYFYQSQTRKWLYQKENLKFLDQLDEYWLGQVKFARINSQRVGLFKGVAIGRPNEFPKFLKPDKVIYYPDGKEAIYIINLGFN